MRPDWRDELVQTLSICLILVRLLAGKSTIWVRLMGSFFLSNSLWHSTQLLALGFVRSLSFSTAQAA